jgi:hypothetical protein
MRRVRLNIGGLIIHGRLRATPTAEAIWEALPFSAAALIWGEEVYFTIPVACAREADAKSVVEPGEIAYWPDGEAIAIGYGKTPISEENETRLAAPCNIWADAEENVRLLKFVASGAAIDCARAGAETAEERTE